MIKHTSENFFFAYLKVERVSSTDAGDMTHMKAVLALPPSEFF